MIMSVSTSADASSGSPSTDGAPTVWGLDAAQLHDRFWSSHGAQVAWPGQVAPPAGGAGFYLLLAPGQFALFDLLPIIERLRWTSPRVLFLRLRDREGDRYQELATTDDTSRLRAFRRVYRSSSPSRIHAALTPDARVASVWARAGSATEGWERLLGETSAASGVSVSCHGSLYRLEDRDASVRFVHDLAAAWVSPGAGVSRATRRNGGVWVDRDARIDAGARLIGSVWVGAGRHVTSDESLVGPAVLWDDPSARPEPEEGASRGAGNLYDSRRHRRRDRGRPPGYLGKRTFDILFSIVVIALCLPLLPLVALAIWLEDGRPIFFAHRRESVGGKEFPCLKFRSMRKDAEAVKEELRKQSVTDGPQFFIEDDPRLTRVGRWIRKFEIDELPQFLNVLVGHMSVVGPRPSPYSENQFCPSWREARLSVRPGVTGLWQVLRTRQEGLDFQEWIRFDIEYVERMSLGLDLWIIWRTILQVARGLLRVSLRILRRRRKKGDAAAGR